MRGSVAIRKVIARWFLQRPSGLKAVSAPGEAAVRTGGGGADRRGGNGGAMSSLAHQHCCDRRRMPRSREGMSGVSGGRGMERVGEAEREQRREEGEKGEEEKETYIGSTL